MAFDNRDSIDFGKEKIAHLFNALFIPTLLGMLCNVTFILADGIFVGRGVGPNGLASVNLASPIMLLITGLGMMFGIGSSVVAAIHLGRNNEKAARINVTQGYIASLFFAAIIAVLLYTCPDFFLRLIGTSETLLPLVHEYLLWFIPTCLLLMVQIVGEFVIRLDGAPKYAMFANIVPAVANIILDYIFIFPLHLGLKGAALATTIGTGFGAGMTVYYMFRKSKKLRFYKLKVTSTSMRLGLRNVSYMMRVGFSGFLGELAGSVTALAGNVAFGKYVGDAGIAAFSVICYIVPVVFNVYYAVSTSAQPIISFNYGAKQHGRVGKTFRFSLRISLIFAAVVTVAAVLFAPQIVSAFLIPGTEPFRLAAIGLPLYAIGFVLIGFNVTAIGYFQSIEHNLISTILVSLRGLFLLIATFALLPHWFGVVGLWIAVPVTEAVTAVCAGAFLRWHK